MDIRIKVPVLLSAVVLLIISCSPQKPASGNYEVVPLPKQIAIKQGNPFILTGKTSSTLAPKATATRAECAAMLQRFAAL